MTASSLPGPHIIQKPESKLEYNTKLSTGHQVLTCAICTPPTNKPKKKKKKKRVRIKTLRVLGLTAVVKT